MLLTQGQQSYQGKNHLDDLLQRAKVVVIVLDLKQVLTTGQIWEEEQLEKYYNQSENINKRVILRNQMRINSDETTFNWIRNLIDNQTINKLQKDSKGYEIKSI